MVKSNLFLPSSVLHESNWANSVGVFLQLLLAAGESDYVDLPAAGSVVAVDC